MSRAERSPSYVNDDKSDSEVEFSLAPSNTLTMEHLASTVTEKWLFQKYNQTAQPAFIRIYRNYRDRNGKLTAYVTFYTFPDGTLVTNLGSRP